MAVETVTESRLYCCERSFMNRWCLTPPPWYAYHLTLPDRNRHHMKMVISDFKIASGFADLYGHRSDWYFMRKFRRGKNRVHYTRAYNYYMHFWEEERKQGIFTGIDCEIMAYFRVGLGRVEMLTRFLEFIPDEIELEPGQKYINHS